jgi:transcriptional regulator with GAF, ATPase, and Fis domain
MSIKNNHQMPMKTLITTVIELEALFADFLREGSASGDVSAPTTANIPPAPGIATLRSARMQFEREYVTTALQTHGWRVPDTARVLGVQRANLYRMMRRLSISRTAAGPGSPQPGESGPA